MWSRNFLPFRSTWVHLRVSKAINRRRTNNTMAKRKKTKGQTMMYKTIHRKLKIEPHLNPEMNPSAPEG
jgi:hypothetical protein